MSADFAFLGVFQPGQVVTTTQVALARVADPKSLPRHSNWRFD